MWGRGLLFFFSLAVVLLVAAVERFTLIPFANTHNFSWRNFDLPNDNVLLRNAHPTKTSTSPDSAPFVIMAPEAFAHTVPIKKKKKKKKKPFNLFFSRPMSAFSSSHS